MSVTKKVLSICGCVLLCLLLVGGGAYIGWSLRVSAPPVVLPQQSSGSMPTWQFRSEHLIYGMPVPIDNRYNFIPESVSHEVSGISVLSNEGCVIGHCDLFKCPVWVSVRWDREHFQISEQAPNPERLFKRDLRLPEYAQAQPEYKAPKDRRMDRGHMARNRDNVGWGEDNAQAGDLMSNIVPQSPELNEQAWRALEDQHRAVVGKGPIKTIWIISGAVFEQMKPVFTVGNGIGVPEETYKIICWKDRDGSLQVRGYLFSQNDRDTNPKKYLVPISIIEQKTGLLFFPELPPDEAKKIKETQPKSMW